MLEAITLLSAFLGIPSALIGISSQASSWRRDLEYNMNPQQAQKILLDQFWEVQHRAQERLNRCIDLEGDSDRNADHELLRTIGRDNAVININRYFGKESLSIENMDRLIYNTENMQSKYNSNKRIKRLADLYTDFFRQELPNFPLLARWYIISADGHIMEDCREIKEMVYLNNQTINQIFNKTNSIEKNTIKSRRVLIEAQNAINSILLSLAMALIGTGVVFMASVITNIELDDVYIVGIPACFLISDLLVCSFRDKKILDMVSGVMYGKSLNRAQKKQFFLELIISVLLQTTISLTCIYMVAKVFHHYNTTRFVFWIISLFLGSLIIQSVREYQKRKLDD